MKSDLESIEIHTLSPAELDRVQRHYVAVGKRLRSEAMRRMVRSVSARLSRSVRNLFSRPGNLAESSRQAS